MILLLRPGQKKHLKWNEWFYSFKSIRLWLILLLRTTVSNGTKGFAIIYLFVGKGTHYYFQWSLIVLSNHGHYSLCYFVNWQCNNAWYNRVYTLIGKLYLVIIANNDSELVWLLHVLNGTTNQFFAGFQMII